MKNRVIKNKGCLAIFVLLWLSVIYGEQKPIVVLIPSYNNIHWCQKNLESAVNQRYENFRVIYIDDASTDGTGEWVERYIAEKGVQDRVTLIRNKQRHGALYNTYKGVWLCQPDAIVATLDGDDWFAHEGVLERLNEEYADPEVWMTYGQFKCYPSGQIGFARALPREVIEKHQIRQYDWVTTHLRSFYAGLFQRIEKKDLLYGEQFFTAAWDLAYMWPMLEMSGVHSRFIPDVLYVYNVVNPLNDHKVHAELQNYFTYVIYSKPPYAPLRTLFKD